MSDVQTFPRHELPDHPQAALIAEQMKRVEVMLDEWVWQVYPNGEVAVIASLQSFQRTLRVWVRDERVNVDVFCGWVPFDAHMLTWILAENFFQEFKARATTPEDGAVPIYVSATYDMESLDHLARFVWAGFQASLTWWGRILQVKVPAPAKPLTA